MRVPGDAYALNEAENLATACLQNENNQLQHCHMQGSEARPFKYRQIYFRFLAQFDYQLLSMGFIASVKL